MAAISLPLIPAPTAAYPAAPLLSLDTLWLQVGGTLCNLHCTHCFISCSPTNHHLELMPLDQVRHYLEEAEALGVREYYLTGGEPFLHPEILEIIEMALKQGPVTVLTNGTLLRPAVANRLREAFDAAKYSLDLRISLDGYNAETNDPIRGAGTFGRILEGIRRLAAVGLNPVITVTEACEGAGSAAGRERFLDFLRSLGLSRPRLKILPLLLLGAEASRSRAYDPVETLRGLHLSPAELEALQCTTCRMVTASGVVVCPILVDFPGARMGQALRDSLRPFELRYPACYTCHAMGLSCRT